MRFTVSSGTLSARLQTLARVINNKSTLNIMDCFLFEIADGTLTLTASDNDNVMTSRIALDSCEGEARFAVNNRTMLSAVKELAEQPLSFEVNEQTLEVEIQYMNGQYRFTAQDADDYPEAQALGEDNTEIVMESATLAECLNRTLFATAQNEIRPVMGGVCFDLTPDCLAIVATDGHKLVRNRLYAITDDNGARFVMPQKPAQLLKTVLPKEGEVSVRFDNRCAEVTYADSTLVCSLIEGRYPNYNSVIPSNNSNCVTVDRKALIGALRRVLPFASESSELVRFHLENGMICLSSEDIDFATSARENVMCEYEGPRMDIGFKGSTIYDVLNNVGGDEVFIKLADPSRSGVIVPTEQEENEELLMLVMPMLLND